MYLQSDSMKLTSMEKRGSSLLKLNFSIESLAQGNQVSEIFDIYNMIEIQFLLKHDEDNGISYFISTKKTESTRGSDSQIEVRIVCKKTGYIYNFICRDHWSHWRALGNDKTSESKTYLNLLFSVNPTVKRSDKISKDLYEDQQFTDFHLTVPDGSVAVHRAHLAANSPVFKEMFDGDWKKATRGFIKMKGVTLQTLQHLKAYMYLGIMPVSGLCPLLLIADYYMIHHLKQECIIKLVHSLTPCNLYQILEFSMLNKLPELTYALLEAMPKHMVKIAQKRSLKSPKRKTIIRPTLHYQKS